MNGAASLALQTDGRKRKRPRQPKLPPAVLEEITQTKYDFQAVIRDEIDEDEISEMFYKEEFVTWRERKLSELRAQMEAAKIDGSGGKVAGLPIRGSRDGDEGGDE
jgi:hypothetical protein